MYRIVSYTNRSHYKQTETCNLACTMSYDRTPKAQPVWLYESKSPAEKKYAWRDIFRRWASQPTHNFKLTKNIGVTRIRARQLIAGHGVNIAGCCCCCRHDVNTDDDDDGDDNNDVIVVVKSASRLHERLQSTSAAHTTCMCVCIEFLLICMLTGYWQIADTFITRN